MSQQWVGGYDGVAYPSPATWPPGTPGDADPGNPNPEVRGRAMTAFMLSAFFTALCCGAGFMVLPALICSGLALGRADLRPDSARELTKWAYIALGAGVGISVIVTAFVVVIGTSDTGQPH